MPTETIVQSALTCASWLSVKGCFALEAIGAGLNSNFSTALLGSLAGAFAGAFTAQRIAERSKRREEFSKELRSVNAAIMVSASICNAVIAVKGQHVKPLLEKFNSDEAARLEFDSQRETGERQGNVGFQYVADLRLFPCPTLPISTLQDLVFNRLTIAGRSLSLVAVLTQSITEMAQAFEKRKSIVETFRDGTVPESEIPYHYFGMRLSSGHTNREYPDIVSALSSYADDCIFFSSLLCEDLMSHGHRVRAEFEKKLGKGAPKISQADFAAVRESGMLPPPSKYGDWLRGFPEQPESAAP